MAEVVATTNNKPAATGVKGLSTFLNQDNVKAKFAEILGQKANGFIASVLSAVSQNEQLKNADQDSIYLAAMMAASLDLPVNSNLGHSYLIPYNARQKDGTNKLVCQFQVSAKGFKQLSIRSGQFKYISDAVVYEGQLKSENPLTGYEFDWAAKKSDKIIGFVSYFQLLNGFESTFYMSDAEMKSHGSRYSKTFGQQFGLWKTDYEKMGLKTVTKLNLSKNAPLSIEMSRATIADQSVIKQYDPSSSEDTLDIETEYIDNTPLSLDAETVSAEKERERVIAHINNANTVAGLKQCFAAIPPEDTELNAQYADKKKELEAKK